MSSYGPPERVAEDPEPHWKKNLRGLFLLGFIGYWLVGIGLGYSMISAYKNGTPKPTATHTVPSTQHGRTVYITPAESARTEMFWTFLLAGAVSLFVVAVAFRLVLKVDVFKTDQSEVDMAKRLMERFK